MKIAILDLVFGPRLEESELAMRYRYRPPLIWRVVCAVSYGVGLAAGIYWGAGKLGWLPVGQVSIDTDTMIAIIAGYWALRFADESVRRHYRKKAETAADL